MHSIFNYSTKNNGKKGEEINYRKNSSYLIRAISPNQFKHGKNKDTKETQFSETSSKASDRYSIHQTTESLAKRKKQRKKEHNRERIRTKNKSVIAVKDIAAAATTNRAEGLGIGELEVGQVAGLKKP